MTTTITFKEQSILTIQERSTAPFHSGCKMLTWSCNETPIRVNLHRSSRRENTRIFFFGLFRIYVQLN